VRFTTFDAERQTDQRRTGSRAGPVRAGGYGGSQSGGAFGARADGSPGTSDDLAESANAVNSR